MSEKTTIAVILIPYKDSEPLQILELNRKSAETTIQTRLCCDHVPENVVKTLLLRPSSDTPGLYAFQDPAWRNRPNIRATRLSMACGIFSGRFFGNVVLMRCSGRDLCLGQVAAACQISPDLRSSVLHELTGESVTPVADWLKDASKHNYHDEAVLAKLASVMQTDRDDDDDDDDCSSEGEDDNDEDDIVSPRSRSLTGKTFITKVPLCLHCRRPASTLCPGCQGVYFCDAPRLCRQEGWSHDCLCQTYRLYTARREELSHFPGLGDWYKQLMGRPFQLSDQPYEEFLKTLGITKDAAQTSWWRTEMDGWSGGMSESAQQIDVSVRRSYKEGFHPIHEGIPLEEPIGREKMTGLSCNTGGLIQLKSWQDYCKLRDLPDTSVASLLLTFPLTLYYSIVEYGTVPCAVARMLQRSLRVHIVGAEKEINFLDLFTEVAFLLPDDISLHLVFVVRHDMLPESVQATAENTFQFAASARLQITLVSGTYGDSLDPNFDCGGVPDMVIAFNAGLYAYESWRSVVSYLEENNGVVGVFTDYNEFSGVQCASLGGSVSRESVRINPFRQPRAMPVLSMNLPQFSNGFLYVMNQQELD